MERTTLFFAEYFPEPKPRIAIETREAMLSGDIYSFESVGGLRSRVAKSEIGRLLSNDLSVGESRAQAELVLRKSFRNRAEKLERKAKRLRAVAEVPAEII